MIDGEEIWDCALRMIYGGMFIVETEYLFVNLKWNQIVKIINEVNDIDSATKKLYLDTIKDLIWVNTK